MLKNILRRRGSWSAVIVRRGGCVAKFVVSRLAQSMQRFHVGFGGAIVAALIITPRQEVRATSAGVKVVAIIPVVVSVIGMVMVMECLLLLVIVVVIVVDVHSAPSTWLPEMQYHCESADKLRQVDHSKVSKLDLVLNSLVPKKVLY